MIAIMLFVFFAIHFGIGFIVGWRYREYVAGKRIIKLNGEIRNLMNKMVIPIYVKTIENQVYVYNTDTNQFLAQGSNLAEVTEKLTAMFPNKLFVPKVGGEYE